MMSLGNTMSRILIIGGLGLVMSHALMEALSERHTLGRLEVGDQSLLFGEGYAIQPTIRNLPIAEAAVIVLPPLELPGWITRVSSALRKRIRMGLSNRTHKVCVRAGSPKTLLMMW